MLPKPSFLENINSNNTTAKQPNSTFNRNNFKSQTNYNSYGNNLRFHNNNKLDFKFGHKQHNNNNCRINNNNNNTDFIKCNHNGCTFTGTKDVVFMHKKIQHFELQNKYNVDFKLDTPDDIERWRAERRARFPTIENGQKKLIESNNKSNVCNGNNNTNKRKNFREKRNRKNDNRKNKRACYDNNNVQSPRNEKLHHTSHNSKISTASNSQTPTDQDPIPKPNSSSLLNLLACYESDEEEEGKIIETTGGTISSSALVQDGNTENREIILKLVSDLIVKVENGYTNHNRAQPNKNDFKKKSKPAKQNCRKSPSQFQLSRNKLNLFQKLMLQDVDNAKADLVECLQILVDSNFLRS